jgi:hypothetical protein
MLGEPIPKKMREEMDSNQYYHSCARARALSDHVCQADPLTRRLIEWEHALYHAGRRLNEPWAIVPLCWLVHRGGKLDKRINEWLALNRATVEELEKYPQAAFMRKRELLNRRYGEPELSTANPPF